jgi:hypothetical protein
MTPYRASRSAYIFSILGSALLRDEHKQQLLNLLYSFLFMYELVHLLEMFYSQRIGKNQKKVEKMYN